MCLASIPVTASLLLVFGLFGFVPLSAASDFVLHSTTTDFLDNTSPTATTAKFKDSAAVNRTTYQEIGTWTAAPVATWMRLNSLSDLHVWIGLKNSDDQGTYFDLRAELRKNGVVTASGETKNIQGVTRNPDNAKEVAVAFGPISGDQFNPSDVLSVKILTKVADSGGHSNAVGLRLYYDAVSRSSKFGAVIVVDNTPPTIAAAVNPAPNAAGWHKSDVTVSFTCADSESGVASCAGPITVTSEGTNQLIIGTATDLAGNSATASLTVNLDKSAPTVAITSPSNGSSVSSSPVRVTGTVSDSLSGLAALLCNANPASLSNSSFACDVSLNNGPNTIAVAATDVAGNASTSNINVVLDQSPSGPGPYAINSEGTLFGENMGDAILLDLTVNESATEYFVYRSTSLNGPWEQVLRISQAAAKTGGAKEDLTPNARLMDLCYKVEAINTTGLVIEFYEAICVPKFVP